MSTETNTTSMSTPLVKRAGLIALFAVLALLMGAKFSGALISGPASGGHTSTAADYYQSTTPGAPTTVTVSSNAAGAVTVAWVNPASTGIPITNYTVTDASGNIVYCTQTTIGGAGQPNSCTFTPTTTSLNGNSVYVAANGGGYSTPSALGATLRVPSAPTITDATQGNGTLKITFTVPTAANASATGYVPTGSNSAANTLATTAYNVYYNSTLVCTTTISYYTQTTTTGYCTINNAAAGLVDGVNYTFTMVAVNPAGSSAASNSYQDATKTTAISTPGAPSNASAVIDLANGTVDITYTAGATSGGGTAVYSVSTYTGLSFPYAATGTTTGYCNKAGLPTGSTAKCAIALSDLASALPYNGTFTVVASNYYKATLFSTATTPSLFITSLLGAPTVTSIAMGSGSTANTLSVSWSAPSGAVTGYNVQLEVCTSTVLNSTCTASGSPKFVTGTSTTFTVSLGSIYNVAVSAVNGSGAGIPALGTSVNTSAASPSAPTVTVTSVTNNSITASFTAPTLTNGSTITSYTAYLYSFDYSTTIGTAKSVAAPGSVTFTGLTAGGSYGVSVWANYGSGSSHSAANTQPSVGYVAGAAPTGLAKLITSTGDTFSWTAFLAPTTITNYTVIAKSASTSVTLCSSTTSSCSATTAQLAAAIALGQTTIAVYTTDANGVAGLLGTNSITIAKPDNTGMNPTANTNGKYSSATATGGDINVVWTAGAGATSYALQALSSNGVIITATTTKTAYKFANVLTSTSGSWTISVAPVNGEGTGTYATANAVTYNSGVTTILTSTTAVSAAPDVTVCTAAMNASAAASSNCKLSTIAASLAGNPIVVALTNDSSAAGVNALFSGAGIANLAPQAQATSGGQALTFFWAPAADSAGNVVTGYTGTLTEANGNVITCTVSGEFAVLAGITMPFNTCTFVGVPTNQAFSFTVVANAPLGNSPGTATSASATIANNTPQAGNVTGLKATPGANGTSVTLTWTAPTSNPTYVSGYVAYTTDTDAGTYSQTNLICSGNAVSSKFAGFGALQPVAYSAATATSVTCTGLNAGDNYTFTVKTATSLTGSVTGLSSGATATAQMFLNPAQPAAPTVAVAAGSNKLTISWTAPTSSEPITSYTISASSIGGTGNRSISACTTQTGNTATISGTNVTVAATITGNPVTATSITCTFASDATLTNAGPFTVVATNGVGGSLSSLPNGLLPTTLRVPATITTAFATQKADYSYVIGWSPVTTDSTLTGYTVTLIGGSSPLTFTTTASNYTVPASALSSTTAYTVTVTANNAAGAGTAKVADQTVNTPIPTAPIVSQYCTGVAAAVCGSLTLSWKNDTANNTTTTTLLPQTYSVYATVSGVNTLLASGLTTTTWATTYSSTTTGYKVVSTNANGSSAPTAVSLNYYALVAPVSPSASVGSITSTGATISWTIGETGKDSTNTTSAAITGYTVTITGSNGTTIACPSLSAASTSCALTGLLASGVTYSYSIIETDLVGSSLPATGAFTTTVSAPGAPLVTSVTSAVGYTATNVSTGDKSITINWTAPASVGGAPLTGYTVSVVTDPTQADAIDYATATTADAMTAYNSAATDAYNSALNVYNAAHTAGDTTAVAPVAPSSLNVGTVTYCSTVLTATSTSCTITGLAASTYYYFQVVANNAGGAGTPANTISGTNDPWNLAVDIVKTKADMGSLSAPKNSSGAYATDAGACAALNCTGLGSVSGLGTAFSATISAVAGAAASAATLAAGGTSGQASTAASVTANATGTALIDGAYALVAQDKQVALSYPALGSITATWAPGTATGSAVTSYVCVATSSLDGTLTKVTVSGTATSCTFTGLSNVPYGIVVTPYGSNSATGAVIVGSSSVSVTSNAYSNITLVNAGGASVAGGSVSAQWIAPTVAPGSTGLAPTGYTVTATDAAGVVKTCTAASTDTVCTVTGLKDSTSYTVSIEANNAVGASSIVTSFVVKTLASSAPTAPTVSSVTSTATGLSVTWAAPASLGSAAKLVGYWVTATDVLSLQQSSCAYNATYGVILAPAVTCEISGLTVGGNYTVSVTAIAVDANLAKLLSPAATKTATFTGVNPEPVIATFSAVTAKQKSVSALTAAAKTALGNLISTVNDGAKITVTGYGTTKAIALARANAAANYLFNNGAAVHVTIATVVSKSVKTALVTVTSN